MRTTAEVGEITLCIEGNLSVFQSVDEFKFVLIALLAEVLDSIGLWNFLADVFIFLARQLEHGLFHLRKIGLRKFNIAEVNPVGEKFDPNKHQAISAIEAEGEPNTVLNVLQKGYTLNDRVLRPALVMVIKGKE